MLCVNLMHNEVSNSNGKEEQIEKKEELEGMVI